MTGNVVSAMIDFYAGDIQRINHFLKVYALAKSIGECEGFPEEARQVLEIAAVTHDIGIKPSEEKYGDCTGPHQELQILVEADFLVNLQEGECSADAIRSVREKLFRTAAGTNYLDRMFLHGK